MLTFFAKKNRHDPTEIPVLGVGLSEADLVALRGGQTLRVDGAQFALPIEVLVFLGASDAALLAEIEAHIGPDTLVRRLGEEAGSREQGAGEEAGSREQGAGEEAGSREQGAGISDLPASCFPLPASPASPAPRFPLLASRSSGFPRFPLPAAEEDPAHA